MQRLESFDYTNGKRGKASSSGTMTSFLLVSCLQVCWHDEPLTLSVFVISSLHAFYGPLPFFSSLGAEVWCKINWTTVLSVCVYSPMPVSSMGSHSPSSHPDWLRPPGDLGDLASTWKWAKKKILFCEFYKKFTHCTFFFLPLFHHV